MEQHTELRKTDPIYEVNQTNTVNFLLSFVGINAASKEDEVTPEDINAAIDVLDVNAFEVKKSKA